MKQNIFPSLLKYMSDREEEFDLIADDRKELLIQLSEYLSQKYQAEESPRLIVICTHNSRRSHMGQLWLSIGAEYLGLSPIESYSGGTEATAFNPRAVSALRKTGIQIEADDPDIRNPIYQIQWKQDMEPYLAFSKKFDHVSNPASSFGAIMVCMEADEACPYVPGADFRLALPYKDPKAFDGTKEEASAYEERAQQIAREILFSLKNVSYL